MLSGFYILPNIEEDQTWPGKTSGFLRYRAGINRRDAAPKSKLGIALIYLKNQWPTLIVYLEDGRIELSNNRAERSIKPFVISRKNFLFANTPGGAQSSAVIFSLIETAKENGLDPYRYLTWLLNEAPRRALSDSDLATTLLLQNAPPQCRSDSTKQAYASRSSHPASSFSI